MEVSQGYLKRQMDTNGGPLIGGEDYFLGQHKNSPITRYVDRCREKFQRFGMLRRQEQA